MRLGFTPTVRLRGDARRPPGTWLRCGAGSKVSGEERGWSVRVQVRSGVEVESRSVADVVWSEAGNDLSLRLSNFSSQNSIMNPLAILEFKGPIGRLSARRHRRSSDWMLAP